MRRIKLRLAEFAGREPAHILGFVPKVLIGGGDGGRGRLGDAETRRRGDAEMRRTIKNQESEDENQATCLDSQFMLTFAATDQCLSLIVSTLKLNESSSHLY